MLSTQTITLPSLRSRRYELAREPPKKPVSTGWELKSTLCLGLAVGLKTGRARKELAGLVLGLSVEGLSISKTQEPDVVARLLQCLRRFAHGLCQTPGRHSTRRALCTHAHVRGGEARASGLWAG